jgi:hypothetical protein
LLSLIEFRDFKALGKNKDYSSSLSVFLLISSSELFLSIFALVFLYKLLLIISVFAPVFLSISIASIASISSVFCLSFCLRITLYSAFFAFFNCSYSDWFNLLILALDLLEPALLVWVLFDFFYTPIIILLMQIRNKNRGRYDSIYKDI